MGDAKVQDEERIKELAMLVWVETWLNKAVGRLGR